jgi:transcriptional regulator with XRE-family HTH domain
MSDKSGKNTGRPTVEINPKQGKRLKELCIEEEITQAQLGREINYSQQTISKIVQGKAPLQPYIAEQIIEKFPSYRREWLLGLDDWKTEEEMQEAIFRIAWGESEKEEDIFADFMFCLGFKFVPNPIPQWKCEQDEQNACDFSEWMANPKSCNITNTKNVIAQCSLEDKNQLKNDIEDFARAWINRLCEKGKVNNG